VTDQPLPDIVEQIAAVAADLDDERLAGSLAVLSEQRARAQVQILIAGTAGSGRAALVNSLLGTDLLPSSPIPKAPVGLQLRYHPALTVQLVAADGRRAIPTAELRTALVDPRLPQRYQYVEIGMPAEILTMVDVRIEDLQSSYAPEDWSHLVARSDFVIVVLNAGALLSQTERDFLRDQLGPRGLHRAALVINQIDQVPEDERESIRAAVRAFLGPFESRPVSIEAVAPQLATDTRHPLRILFADLAASSLRLRESAVRDAAAAALDEIEAVAAGSLALASLEVEQVERARAALAERQEWLRGRIERVQRRVDALIGTVVREQMHEAIRGSGEVIRRLLPEEIAAVDDLQDVRRYLPGYLQSLWEEILERRMTAIRASLEDEAGRIEELIESDLRELVEAVEGSLGATAGAFGGQNTARVFVMPRRSQSHAESVARGLSLHGFVWLIIATFFPVSFIPGLLTLGGSHLIRHFYARDIEDANRKALTEAALAATRDLERDIHTEVDRQFGDLAADMHRAVADRYQDAVRRLEAMLGQGTADRAAMEERRERLTRLVAETIPALRQEMERGEKAGAV